MIEAETNGGAPSPVAFLPATHDLAVRYYGGRPPVTFRGHVAVIEERVVGVGGISFVGDVPWIFSEMTDEMRVRRKDCARAVRVLEKQAADFAGPLFAVVTATSAPRLLERMGFEPTGLDMDEGAVRGPIWVRP